MPLYRSKELPGAPGKDATRTKGIATRSKKLLGPLPQVPCQLRRAGASRSTGGLAAGGSDAAALAEAGGSGMERTQGTGMRVLNRVLNR